MQNECPIPGRSRICLRPRPLADRDLPGPGTPFAVFDARREPRARRTCASALQDRNRRGRHMARYGKKAQEKVERAMHERKRGTLKSGRSGKTVRSRKQAIAIGLSEARREGGKVPKQKTSRKSGRRSR